MTDTLKTVSDYGVLLVIAAVFIWDKIANARAIESVLKELQSASKLQSDTLRSLQHTSENTSTALQLLLNSLSGLTASLERHDKRSEFMNADIREICGLLGRRPCVKDADREPEYLDKR